MGVNWEIVKITGIGWLVIFSVIFSVVYIKRVLSEQAWLKKWVHFREESPQNIERVLVSFDKAIFPKIATDEDGIISNVNISAEHLFGWKEIELVGRSVEIVIPEKERPKFKEMLMNLRGHSMVLRSFYQTVWTRSHQEIQTETIFKKDEIRRGYYVYLFVFRDRAKELQMIKKLQQVIEIHKKKIDILTKGEELGNTGSWIWDLEDNELTVSEGYKRIIGLEPKAPNTISAGELRGRVWWEDEEKVAEALKTAFAGKPYVIQYKQTRPKDFKLVTVRSVVEPILNEAKVPIGFYGSTTKLAEENLIRNPTK